MLVEEYVASGNVFFEYRDYAFRGAGATRAAEAAFCAAEQDAFWPFHDSIFQNQQRYGAAGGFPDDVLRGIAEGLGLDLAAYDACIGSDAPGEAVQAMVDEARASGVNSTPSLFVNGQQIDWQGWDGLKAAIDVALAGGAGASATPEGEATPAP